MGLVHGRRVKKNTVEGHIVEQKAYIKNQSDIEKGRARYRAAKRRKASLERERLTKNLKEMERISETVRKGGSEDKT